MQALYLSLSLRGTMTCVFILLQDLKSKYIYNCLALASENNHKSGTSKEKFNPYAISVL